VGATENIKEGNEDIREVMSLNNVSKLTSFSYVSVLPKSYSNKLYTQHG